MSEYMTSNEIMETLRISRTSLNRLIDSGKIVARKPFGKLLFLRSEILEHIESSIVESTKSIYHGTGSRKKKAQPYVHGEKWV
jgi:predicted site-specific integrase-resolvase